MVNTYNSRAKYPHCVEYNSQGGCPTYGGYSQFIVVNEKYVLRIPSNLDLASATPLLSTGITTYSPLKYYGLKRSHRFAVFGLGGLGHMGVKFGLAFGAHTTVISRGTGKMNSALKDLGADAYIDSTDAAQMGAAAESFDMILDCVSSDHEIGPLFQLLKTNGKLILVGVPPGEIAVQPYSIINSRKLLCGSMVGGIEETQEMLAFCGANKITADIELISAAYINTAYERCLRSEVLYRFVIDISTL